MPWFYPELMLDEEAILNEMGLMRAYTSIDGPIDAQKSSRVLFFPDQYMMEDHKRVLCDQATWKQRQALTYFLNIHILSQGGWVPQDICRDLKQQLADPWYPGKFVSDSLSRHMPNKKEFYLRIDDLYIQPLPSGPCRKIKHEDLYIGNQGVEWGPIIDYIDGSQYSLGNKAWNVSFGALIKKEWIKFGEAIQKTQSLTYQAIWRSRFPTPEAAVGDVST